MVFAAWPLARHIGGAARDENGASLGGLCLGEHNQVIELAGGGTEKQPSQAIHAQQ